MTYHRVVGIDLGTTYSAVAAHSHAKDEAVVLRNRETDKETTPSVVSIDSVTGKVIVGEAAKRNLTMHPEHTIIEIKRLMGEVFTRELLDRHDPQRKGNFHVQGEIVDGKEHPGSPAQVTFRGEWFYPQEISAFTLMKMKQIAEAELGGDINDAVITVPAFFKVQHRKATEEAARLAGLYPRQLIPEPTAAAIAYGVDEYDSEKRVYLVYDLGGGTFDVSIITVEGDKIDVVATAGDRHLGGGDFDDAIAEWTIERLLKDHGIDVTNDPKARALVKYKAEYAKQELSVFESAKLVFMELRPDSPPIVEITRPTFVDLIKERLKKSTDCVNTALKYAKENHVAPESIDAILLVGGSSKIPYVKTMLLEYFKKEDDFVRADVNPDTAVARGAAILAKRFEPTPSPFDVARTFSDSDAAAGSDDVEIRAITEHTLGIGVVDENDEPAVSPIVKRGNRIPVTVTREKFTNGGPDTLIPVRVYQGEGTHPIDCELVGIVTLGPMEPMPPHHHRFDVTFSLDRGGLLTAVVHHVNEKKHYHGVFQPPTAIATADLGRIRENLLGMYRGDHPKEFKVERAGETPPDATSAPPPPATSQAAPPPEATTAPPPATADHSQSGNGASTASADVPPAVASAEAGPAASRGAPSDAGPAYSAEPVASEEGGTATAVATPPAAAAFQLAPGVEAPEQFKSILRRAQRAVEKQPEPTLVAALSAFVEALNRSASLAEIEELGDELDDAYLKTMRT